MSVPSWKSIMTIDRLEPEIERTRSTPLSPDIAVSIAKDSGGKDKTCGTSDDDPLLSIGWGAVAACPGFESGSCNAPIAGQGPLVRRSLISRIGAERAVPAAAARSSRAT